MRPKALVLALVFLIAWLFLSWFLPAWLNLRQQDLWILRLALSSLGFAGTIALIWFYGRKPTGEGPASLSVAKEIDLTFARAAERLKTAKFGGKRISQFPTILLLGDTGSAKTTILQRSGLNPELLAGQGVNDYPSTPTTGINLWLARGAVVLDPAGGILKDRAAFSKVSGRLAPAVSGALANEKAQARAVVLCVSCEAFRQAGATEVLNAKAREYRELLSELATSLGSAIPVYVLFTKADTLSYFSEYAGTLTTEEAEDVFGATLPLMPRMAGSNGQGNAHFISEALTKLFPVLSDRRLRYLAREHDPLKASAVYEFPREFRKLRPLFQAFLSELSRPLQLQLNPIVRGFYFTGVRAIVVNDIVSAPTVLAARAAQAEYNDATRIFVAPVKVAEGPIPQPASSRRVPQWVYLNRLFPEVILADRAALDSSRQNVKSGRIQSLSLIAVSLAALALAATWTVSFLANYRLVTMTRDAIQSANETRPGPGLASEVTIRRLEPAREALGILNRAEGVPSHMRWGLYSGEGLYEPTFESWFGGFARVLLTPTQANLAGTLSQAGKSNTGDYHAIYSALKAYLITTQNPDKNAEQTPSNFSLSAILQRHWQKGEILPKEHTAAALAEFDYYSDLLSHTNPWTHATAANAAAVASARSFLNRLSGTESLYLQIVSRLNQDPPIVFNRLYPGSDRFVVNSYPVPAAFTKSGWAVAQKSIRNLSDYFKGEEWVLGPAAFANVDTTRLQKDLETRYKLDYSKHWREYLRHTSVVHFANIKDASAKLSILSSNQSPLLESLCVASENTADPALQDTFQPPRQVTPQGCTDHLSSPANDAYLQGLIGLQASLTALGTDENSEALRGAALQKATDADVAVSQAASKFAVDKEHVVDAETRNTLEAPIQYARQLISGATKDAANGAAGAFCSQFNAVMRKYPFNRASRQDATVKEVNDLLAPNQGALWKLYSEQLQKYVLLVGTSFSARPGAPSPPSPGFIFFLNRASAISDALYHGGSDMKFSFDLRVLPEENVQAVSLSINGQTLSYPAGGSSQQHFTWPGAGSEEVRLRVRFAGGTEMDYPPDTGAWDLFHFFDESEMWQMRGNEYQMEKPLRSGYRTMMVPATGRPATVRFGLGMSGAAALRPGALSGTGCVGVVTK